MSCTVVQYEEFLGIQAKLTYACGGLVIRASIFSSCFGNKSIQLDGIIGSIDVIWDNSSSVGLLMTRCNEETHKRFYGIPYVTVKATSKRIMCQVARV